MLLAFVFHHLLPCAYWLLWKSAVASLCLPLAALGV